ncbi:MULTISPECIES: hypothetical protein [unclassified Rhizobium]|uniref:hypothetical protein n=1 Tax=unclassified Rhizobium TaxID=2613769 RepID=UPI00113127C3|nr:MULTISPECIES: hypothetical protein [unclassified Rhizobium]
MLKNSLGANALSAILLVPCRLLLIAAGRRRNTIMTLADAIACSIVFCFRLASGMFITVGNAGEPNDVPFFIITAVIVFVGRASRSEILARSRDRPGPHP